MTKASSTVLAGAVIALACCSWAFGQAGRSGEKQPFKVPHKPDETALVRVEANPERYAGTVFTICGGVGIGSYYNYAYNHAESQFYSLRFVELGEDTSKPLNKAATLYLRKPQGARIVDTITKWVESASRRGGRGTGYADYGSR